MVTQSTKLEKEKQREKRKNCSEENQLNHRWRETQNISESLQFQVSFEPLTV